MDIVKINNRYALRRYNFIIFKYQYADRDNLKDNRKLHWWTRDSEIKWSSWETLEELETDIDNYNPQLAKQKSKNMAKERKERLQGEVVKKKVKFGCKNK